MAKIVSLILALLMVFCAVPVSAAQNVDGVYAECSFEFLSDDQFTSEEKQACLETLTSSIVRSAFGGFGAPAGGSVTPDPPDYKSCAEREACRAWDDCLGAAAPRNCYAEHEAHLNDPDNPHNLVS